MINLNQMSFSQSNINKYKKLRNPNGKVPVLETPDGFLFESQAILRYIARIKPAVGLYGENLY